MKLNKTLTALIAGASIGISGQALAIGTTAGDNVENTVLLDYKVGGVTQETLDAVNTFKVDNRVDMTLTASATATAYPGQTVTYTYTFKNDGNKEQIFRLGIEDSALTDTFTVSSVSYDNIQYNTGSGASIANSNELTIPADVELTYDVTFTFPTTLIDTSTIENGNTLSLIATATGIDSLSADLVGNNGDSKNTTADLIKELIVFADGATTYSDANNGSVNDDTLVTIETANFTDGSGGAGPGLTVLAVNDPLCNGTYNAATGGIAACDGAIPGYTPKAIPGALVEYTLTAENSSVSVAAENAQFVKIINDITGLKVNTLSNIKVELNGVDITSDADYIYNATTYTIQDSSVSTLSINVENVPATQAVVITFTAEVDDGL